MFTATILTLFPEMFPGPLGLSLSGKALEKGLWSLETLQIRDYATDKHKTVDGSCYGGGTGLLMKPDVVDSALEAAKAKHPNSVIVYPSPRGERFSQSLAKKLVQNDVIFLCGRYEGIDQRIFEKHDIVEVSLGDYILSGGELAAMIMLDAALRLLPGVIGDESATHEESFGDNENYAGLLEYDQYSRPPLWKGLSVPEVLLSGDHAKIAAWRLAQAEEITKKRRPDLWEIYTKKKPR